MARLVATESYELQLVSAPAMIAMATRLTWSTSTDSDDEKGDDDDDDYARWRKLERRDLPEKRWPRRDGAPPLFG